MDLDVEGTNMWKKSAIVITSVSAPNISLQSIADGALKHHCDLIVVGDVSSPPDFEMAGCRFFDLKQQRQTCLHFSEHCPMYSYARKNIGYLMAMGSGAEIIIDMDDDCIPCESFWNDRKRRCTVPFVKDAGWVNVYHYFTEEFIWPRGFPLRKVRCSPPLLESFSVMERDCVIQQCLVNNDPDVDAIYRLLHPLPMDFTQGNSLALGRGAWCPFNSQNTTWWKDAFPLLYLPISCSFRMTDIWRSFVAQRIAWENGWSVGFHGPTVRQERNSHNIMDDFAKEVPGYLHNEEICETLSNLPVKGGYENLLDDMLLCYRAFLKKGWVEKAELDMLQAWFFDLENVWPRYI